MTDWDWSYLVEDDGVNSASTAMDVLATLFVVFVLVTALATALSRAAEVSEQASYLLISTWIQLPDSYDSRQLFPDTPTLSAVVRRLDANGAELEQAPVLLGTEERLKAAFGSSSSINVRRDSGRGALALTAYVLNPEFGRYRVEVFAQDRLEQLQNSVDPIDICIHIQYPLQKSVLAQPCQRLAAVGQDRRVLRREFEYEKYVF